MKKQQENSTHKNNSALFCESIYFKSPVFRNSLSLNSQVFRHSLTLYLVGGDHGLAFRKKPCYPQIPLRKRTLSVGADTEARAGSQTNCPFHARWTFCEYHRLCDAVKQCWEREGSCGVRAQSPRWARPPVREQSTALTGLYTASQQGGCNNSRAENFQQCSCAGGERVLK